MKYICLCYAAEEKWADLSDDERRRFIEDCLAYDAMLRQSGHIVGGEALERVRTATTLRFSHGKATITDGPFAETKEQLGGFHLLEAKDLNHAIQLMSKHPAGRLGGCFELRPTVDLESIQIVGGN